MSNRKSRKWIIIILVPSVLVGITAAVLFPRYYKSHIAQAYKIPTSGMKPTLLVGDYIIADKSIRKLDQIERGDIIIFAYPKDPSKDYIKRIIGLPDDLIKIKNKALYINGILYEEEYVVHEDNRIFPRDKPPYAIRDNFGPITVPENALFVLGDNRDSSNDSRFWGFVDIYDLKGRATTIYWSVDRENNKVRWERIWKEIK